MQNQKADDYLSFWGDPQGKKAISPFF